MKGSFGRTLRRIRTEANKTMLDVARELGISVAYLSDVERGNRAPFRHEQVLQIARFLDIHDPNELLATAAVDRGSFTLPANVGASGQEAGAALMLGWSKMRPDDFAKILGIVRAAEEMEGQRAEQAGYTQATERSEA